MVSGPTTSWQIDGEKVEAVADFIFLGSKITEDSDCSHKIKRHLLLRMNSMPMSGLFSLGGQSIGASASASGLLVSKD